MRYHVVGIDISGTRLIGVDWELVQAGEVHLDHPRVDVAHVLTCEGTLGLWDRTEGKGRAYSGYIGERHLSEAVLICRFSALAE